MDYITAIISYIYIPKMNYNASKISYIYITPKMSYIYI